MMKFLTGAAAKAGIAAIAGVIGAPGLVAGTNLLSTGQAVGDDVMMSLFGYIIVGALGGAINWATVYFKRNEGYK